MNSKNCTKCRKSLPLLYYYKKKGGANGVDSKCKNCVLKSKKQSYQSKKAIQNNTIISINDPVFAPTDELVLTFLRNINDY